MAVGPNLLRRGAVYHWRKRLPRSLVPFMGCSHLCLSLNTKDSREARFLGAHLDAIAMDVFLAPSTATMSKAQLSQLFKAAQRTTTIDAVNSPLIVSRSVASSRATRPPSFSIAVMASATD